MDLLACTESLLAARYSNDDSAAATLLAAIGLPVHAVERRSCVLSENTAFREPVLLLAFPCHYSY